MMGMGISERDGGPRRTWAGNEPAEQLEIAKVRAGDVLFVPGTAKQFLYWVNSGQVELRWPSAARGADEIEILTAGDYFGLGFLDYHVCSAVARTDAAIECLPRALAAQLVDLDPEINARDGAETQREFTHRRETVIASASQALPQRLAAFLLVLARLNADEGRDPSIVHDEMTGPVPVVCTYLATDADALGSALKQLSDLGAIELLPPRGVRICDLDYLGYIARCQEPASYAHPV
jgi:CRP-like cAMP-binding protein